MNQDNLAFLKNQLRYTGFGETLFTSLEEHIRAGDGEFRLGIGYHTEHIHMDASLLFQRSQHSDFYYFNRYTAVLLTADGPREQIFFISSLFSQNITFVEARNLLEGRAVKKDFVKKDDLSALKAGEDVPVQKTWVQLDLEKPDEKFGHRLVRYYQKHGFGIESALERTGIKPRIFSDRLSDVVYHLEKGNRCPVLLQQEEGAPVPVWLEAVPKYRNLAMFDENGTRLYVPSGIKLEEQQPEEAVSAETTGEVNEEEMVSAESQVVQPPAPNTPRKRKQKKIEIA